MFKIKEKTVNDSVTPHKISIAVLVKSFCSYRDTDEYKDSNGKLKAKYRKDFCSLLLKLLQSPDLSLDELTEILISNRYLIHNHVIKIFEETLKDIYINGIGTLLDVVDVNLNRVIFVSSTNITDDSLKCFVSKSSIFGYFLRRLILNFEKLSFSELASYFTLFSNYYEKGSLYQESTKNNCTLIVKQLLCSNDWSAGRQQWSRRQAELFLATQAALLNTNVEKALSPIEMQSRIENLLISNPSLYEAHFLSYLNNLRINEFCGALESIYHCFDRSTLSFSSGNTIEEKSRVYRYAALNLAILYHHFGHNQEALAALHEAVTMSQINNDNLCLQHSLSWLYRLVDFNRHDLIKQSIKTSCHMNMYSLVSLSIQCFVHDTHLVERQLPANVFDCVMQSDILNCQQNLRDLTSHSFATRSALWQYYGNSSMSSLWSNLQLFLNIENVNPTKGYYGEGFFSSVCYVITTLLEHGEYNLVNTIISYGKDKFPSRSDVHIWMLCENTFTYTRAFYHRNFTLANEAAQKIRIIDDWDGQLKLAEIHIAKNEIFPSLYILDELIKEFHDRGFVLNKPHYMIKAVSLKSYIEGLLNLPIQKIPKGTLELLNECLQVAEKTHLNYLQSVVTLHLAILHYNAGLITQAKEIFDKCILNLLKDGPLFDRALGSMYYIRCLINELFICLALPEKRSAVKIILPLVNNAKNDLKKLEAIFYYEELLRIELFLYNYAEMTEKRNACAKELILVEKEQASYFYLRTNEGESSQ